MLPIPIENFIPKDMADNVTPAGQAWIDKHNQLIQSILDDIINLETLLDPVRCHSQFLWFLGNFVYAEIMPGDDERTQRIKIAEATERHKARSLWEADLKLRIDSVANTNAVLYEARSILNDDAVFIDGSEEITNTWAAFGDGSTDPDDEMFTGSGNEPTVAGNIYIDMQDGTLTATQITKIKEQVNIHGGYSFFRFFLGYVSGGVFTEYPNGRIE